MATSRFSRFMSASRVFLAFTALCLGAMGLMFWRTALQEKRDADLIQAVCENDSVRADALLQSGADPNAPPLLKNVFYRLFTAARGGSAMSPSAPVHKRDRVLDAAFLSPTRTPRSGNTHASKAVFQYWITSLRQ